MHTKHVVFLLPHGLLKPASLFGALEVLEKANDYAAQHGAGLRYHVDLRGADVGQGLLQAQLLAHWPTDAAPATAPELVVVPAVHETLDCTLPENQELIEWLRQQYKGGTELASLCTGAFFLAATGLLNGRECATHWKAAAAFQQQYPEVKLKADRILTDTKGLYTAGGATSSLNLMLYLVEKYSGRATALYCAKVLQLDIDRSSQAPFRLLESQKSHDDEAIRQAQTYIEQQLSERLTVELLANKFDMSPRNFVRRFQKATGNAPGEYVQRVKMEAVKRTLESTRHNVTEAMYAVGYNDPKTFRSAFKKLTGLTPLDYKLKFGHL